MGGITRLGVLLWKTMSPGSPARQDAPMNPQGGSWGPPCPVCGRPVGDIGAGQCPGCGLPAAGQAALVVARIGATLTDLARDRDTLLASLRAAAPGAPGWQQPAPPPGITAPPMAAPAPWAPAPPPPPVPAPVSRP